MLPDSCSSSRLKTVELDFIWVPLFYLIIYFCIFLLRNGPNSFIVGSCLTLDQNLSLSNRVGLQRKIEVVTIARIFL